MKLKQDYLIGDRAGVHRILEVLGPREIKGRKYKTIEIFYRIKCSLCGNEREINQRSLKNGGAGATYYCSACPRQVQTEGRRRKRADYDKERRKEQLLSYNDYKLFRIAIYGDLA